MLGSGLTQMKYQRGIALLIFTIVLAMAAITYFLTTMSPAEIKIDHQQQTQAALKQAKIVLIAHAVTHADQPLDKGEFGDLPCPDTAIGGFGGEGASDSPCGTDKAATIGYFPWRSLGVDALRDSAGNCLFYAVSASYKITTNPVPVMLNADTNGMFQIVDSTGAVIEGATASTRPVAVIFAAGPVLAGQNRVPDSTKICGEDYNLSAYLDNNGVTDNANPQIAEDVVSQFVNASPGSETMANPLNDQLITISRDELWQAILRRSDFTAKMNNLTQALTKCLVAYSANVSNTGRRLPWPAAVDFAGADYRDSPNYTDVAIYAGRYPYRIDNTNAALGLAGGDLLDRPECASIDIGTGTPVNLNNTGGEYRKLWENWKDHFYYALSKAYEPTAITPATCNILLDCVTVEPFPYGTLPKQSFAGIVFYSSSKLSALGQSRDTLPPAGDTDDKANVSNYLENGNDAIIKMATGTPADDYKYPDTNSNDVMWCIENQSIGLPLDVVPCQPGMP